MKKLLRVVGMLAIAFGGLALQPAHRTANALYASETSSRDCLFYKYYTVGGGTVTCYDEHGTGCAVCAT
jgi:hypothetical protein